MITHNANILTNEQKMLILLSRLTFSAEDIEQIKAIGPNINWFDVFKYSFYHKTATLCWKNAKKVFPKLKIPRYLSDCLNYIYCCTTDRNTKMLDECRRIVNILKLSGIVCIPVKGMFLLNTIYPDIGIRHSGDCDFLIRHSDVSKLHILLQENGYTMGTYSSTTKQITPVTRFEDIKWKTFMSNLHPYLRLTNDKFFPIFKLDFRFALDDTLSKESVNEIIDFYQQNGFVANYHYLIHLFTHFYDEAKHSATIATAKDLNMSKLLDIREFIIQRLSPQELHQTVLFAKKHKLEDAMYFTVSCLKKIYNDGYEEALLANLVVSSSDILNTFGDNTQYANMTFKKDFWERFFSCDNKDELISIPKLHVSLTE